MADSYQALQQFWSSFGWKAYDENTVPDDAMELNNGKYITYEAAISAFDETTYLTASLWMRSSAWDEISLKAIEIFESIGRGGKLLNTNNGYLWVTRGTPFAQRMGEDDDMIRRIYLNIQAEFMTAERR